MFTSRLPFTFGWLALLVPVTLLLSLGPVGTESLHAASFDETYQLFLAGKYDEAQAVAAAEVERGVWNRRWPELLIECMLVRGQYAEALVQYDAALQRFPTSLSLRLLGIEAVRYNNLPDRAGQEVARFQQVLQSGQLQFASRDTLIAAGRFLAMRDLDARKILELFYDRVRESNPTFLDAYLATAELAINKGDFGVAAETLNQAKRDHAGDPRVHYWTAKAFESSDSKATAEALMKALEINPKHTPSLILQADMLIDREQYESAEEVIDEVLAINPSHPEAIALQAVLAHLSGDYEAEKKLRDKAMEAWPQNPEVDHLIGRKLSQKYRFAEGADYQRSALLLDPDHVGASFQLAQDLLRLGEDDIGWKLAEDVSTQDEYNVVAYNLMTLRDRIKGFTELSADGILIRMEPREAAIYGDAVMELLKQARQVLCDKYDVQPDKTIVVEIFPEQSDFAIRTFGLPGGQGFLGVCFGRVITANSPASQGARPANWQSVLWHEFCHVVTLEKTKNRMPRWLSEGISVYEERLRDPSWGQSMSAGYRRMILGDDLTKVSELSGAFLSPPSGMHLQFAYYESSLVVEYLVEQYGMDALLQILDSLATGVPINDALAMSVGSIDKLDVQFAEYAQQKAREFAPQADWSVEDYPEKPSEESLQDWLKEHPNSYAAHRDLASLLTAKGQMEAARVHLEKLVELGAVSSEEDGPLEMLAAIHRKLGDQAAEIDALNKISAISSDALPTHRRLIELGRDAEDWQSVREHADAALAIQPLAEDLHQANIDASLAMGEPENALPSLEALRNMEPVDPAGLDYQMAKTHAEIGDVQQAQRFVLMALDRAPRYRDAHRLLLDLATTKQETARQETAETNSDAGGESELGKTQSGETQSGETQSDETEKDEPTEQTK
ncbi:tetratricopeptide repeat protein [Stieleria varia]|uniref:Cellulose synthase subunit BcsC n=1 Tax=Stieleria varia TaxID=2528005 RepID=A0A5C6AW95_9BACT|nr:tetratricopeptide repeat protein [Stieleria varia]TWU02404.1 cellulose synthase subunit BcsC [Stieleria varia]